MRPKPGIFFLFAAMAITGLPLPARAQLLDVHPRGTEAKMHILAFFPGAKDAGELILFDDAGHRLMARMLPFRLRAACIASDGGFAAAPNTGGLLYLDGNMHVKMHIPGYAYETLVCTSDAVYAAGRTTRIHRFEFPGLLDRRKVAEANSFVPRMMAAGNMLAAISWDGSAILLRENAPPLRVYTGTRSLIGLARGPQNSWILLAENSRISVIGPAGAENARFHAESARMLAASEQGILAVLDTDNKIRFYHRVAPYWLLMRRTLQLPEAVTPTAMAHVSGKRWVVLTPSGLVFFEEPR